jgi:hypothetical protein
VNEAQRQHYERFGKVSIHYPRYVLDADDGDFRRAMADNDEQVAMTIAAWERQEVSSPASGVRPGSAKRTENHGQISRPVASATSRFLRSSAGLKIVRGWPCEVDAAPLRGRDGDAESREERPIGVLSAPGGFRRRVGAGKNPSKS